MRRTALALVPLTALVLVAGCGGGDTEEAASTGTSASSTSAPVTSTAAGTSSASSDEEVGPSDAPPFPADTALDTAEVVPGEGPTVITGIRTGTQDGFGRVVFDISGTTVPGWYVTYVDSPAKEGSGDPVQVPGSAYLQVSLRGVANPYEAPEVAEAPVGTVSVDAGPVVGVYYDSVFEGQSLAYVGVSAEQPFRVYALTNPTRVVVDIQD